MFYKVQDTRLNSVNSNSESLVLTCYVLSSSDFSVVEPVLVNNTFRLGGLLLLLVSKYWNLTHQKKVGRAFLNVKYT